MKQYNNLADFIKKGIKNNVDRNDMYFKAVNRHGYENSYRAFSKYVTNIKRRYFKNIDDSTYHNNDDIEPHLIKILRENTFISIDDLCNKLSCGKTKLNELINDFRKSGYEIIVFDDKILLSNNKVANTNNIHNELENKEIIFGVASDLHFGSKAAQITALNEFSEICKKNNVKYMFSPGDIVAGYSVYPGQLYDLYAISATEQENSVIKNLPTGFEWIMIGGNHDYNFIKKGGGHNPLSVIENYRNDVKYIGFDKAVVPILKNVDLMMWHPSGGVPYSISYRLQKGIEQIALTELKNICMGNKEKPTLRFVLAGHLHIQLQAMFGSLFGMQCGTFEGTTDYLKRKGLDPAVGGWIVKAELGNDGLLKNFEAKFHFFPEIEDDYRNYNHTLERDTKIEKPIFGE